MSRPPCLNSFNYIPYNILHNNGYWCTRVLRFFVCVEFIVSLENFSLILRRHHCRWRAAKFDLCSVLMTIEQWGFFNAPHLLWHGLILYMVISEDPWHSHLLPSVWQWSCYYLFLRLRSFATGDRTPISRMRGERSTSTPPRRWEFFDM